jgi:uncharacterized protein
MGRSGRPRKCDPQVDNLRYNISQDDFETAKRTLSEFGIDAQDGPGRTALINAVIENKIDFIKWLIDNGANINIQDRNGYSAVHFMAQKRLTKLAQYILKHNPDLELRDIHGNTPIWTAIINGREDLGVAKLLIDKGANLENLNNAGTTPREAIKIIYGNTFDKEIKRIEI